MIRNDTHINTNRYVPIFLVLFGLIFARYCYYGFEYYYQLDDYIQYHNYTAYNKDLWAAVIKLGLLGARPLAGLGDVFVWSHFYSRMIIAVGIISAMYAFSAVLLHRVFSRHFGTGYLFFVVYALMPLGFEGAYWVSASSRIVVGLFFASLSLFFFQSWCDGGKKRNLFLFAFIQLVSFCFYEQVILFSGAATLIVMLCSVKGKTRPRARFGLMMFVNAGIYFAITKLVPSGINGERTVLFMPWQKDYEKEMLTPLLKQLKTTFLDGSAATFGKGLTRGLKLLISEPNAVYVLIIIALCTALYIIIKNARRADFSFFPELFSGVLLAIVPLLIFFFIKEPWFGLRNTVPSFCGLALILDAVFDLICGRFKRGYIAEALIAAALALLCCTASVSEIHDYREITMSDSSLTAAACEALKDTKISVHESVWLLNVDETYLKDGNLYYHEHDYGVSSSTWAMTGAVAAVSGREDIASKLTLVPIHNSGYVETDREKVGSIPSFWYQNGSFVPTDIIKIDSDTWYVTNKTGEKLGTLQNRYGYIYLTKKRTG